MTVHESALSDLAARLAGTDTSLSTSLRDILTAGDALRSTWVADKDPEALPELRHVTDAVGRRTSPSGVLNVAVVVDR